MIGRPSRTTMVRFSIVTILAFGLVHRLGKRGLPPGGTPTVKKDGGARRTLEGRGMAVVPWRGKNRVCGTS